MGPPFFYPVLPVTLEGKILVSEFNHPLDMNNGTTCDILRRPSLTNGIASAIPTKEDLEEA